MRVSARGPSSEADPPSFDQTMKCWVERALLNEQNVLGAMFDGLRDGVAVSWTELKGAKDQEIESALEEFDAFFHRHSRRSVIRLTWHVKVIEWHCQVPGTDPKLVSTMSCF